MTPTEFKLKYPQFAAVDDARVQLFLDDSALLLSEECWGDLYNKGIELLTAHELTLASVTDGAAISAGISSNTTQKKAGDVSVGKDASLIAAENENPYLRTTYGQSYLYYLRIVGTTALTV